GGVADRVFVGRHVVVPGLSFLRVVLRELPVLLRLLDPFEEPPSLLLLRDVEEELADDDAVPREVALEVADVPEALLPDVLRDDLRWQLLLRQEFRMHADDEGLLVVAAVEDADAPALRKALHAPPEVIVVEVLGRRRLERDDIAALRIDPGHDVLDRPVLASSVHGLEDEQHGPAVLRVEHVLELSQRLDAQREHLLRARLVLGPEVERVSGVEVLQAESVPVRDPERLRERAGPLDQFLDLHGSTPDSHPIFLRPRGQTQAFAASQIQSVRGFGRGSPCPHSRARGARGPLLPWSLRAGRRPVSPRALARTLTRPAPR